MADDNVAAVLHKVDDIRLDACPVPQPGPDQVGVCGCVCMISDWTPVLFLNQDLTRWVCVVVCV